MAITDIKGVKVGHATDLEGITGCTVILVESGAVAGVDQRGGSPGTREIALLNPINQVDQVHGILLAGGSAFGLDAASGVVRFLEERGVGYPTGAARVPIVPAAILFDLAIGNHESRPTPEMGYEASAAASSSPPKQGSVGAGTGATVGKLLGMGQATKAGIGTASIDVGGGVSVGAIVAVNAVGDVIDPETNQILAGVRPLEKGPLRIGEEGTFADSLTVLRSFPGRTLLSLAERANTVIGVVATNASFNKAEVTKLAQMAQNGVVRTIRPANTMYDGDTIFALSTGKKKANLTIVGSFAAQAMQLAIMNAIRSADSLAGIPASKDLLKED